MRFECDDGGRIASGRCGHDVKPASDCVIRSIAIVGKYEYEQVVIGIQSFIDEAERMGVYKKFNIKPCNFEEGEGVCPWVYENFLRALGYRAFYYKVGERPVVKDMPFKRCIVLMQRHLGAIINAEYHDIKDRKHWKAYGYYLPHRQNTELHRALRGL